MNGVTTRQCSISCGESMVKHWSSIDRPVSNPPPNWMPLASRPSSVTLKKWFRRMSLPNLSVRVMMFSTWPNLSGLRSYSPQISLPPPPGSPGWLGAMTQYGL